MRIGRWEIRLGLHGSRLKLDRRACRALPASWHGTRDRYMSTCGGVSVKRVAEVFIAQVGPLWMRRRAAWRVWGEE